MHESLDTNDALLFCAPVKAANWPGGGVSTSIKLETCTVRSPAEHSVGVGEELSPGVEGLVVYADDGVPSA